MEDVSLRTRLVEGKFPEYQRFIPESVDKEVLAEKKKLLSALKRVTHIGSTVKMELEKDRMRLSTLSQDVGEAWEEVSVEYNGEAITIAFNGKFLEDGISSVEGGKVYIGLTEPLKPAVIKEEDSDDFLYLVMPVRL
jgi:DNA polymerase-3 subunit beta